MDYEDRVLAACKASPRIYVLNPKFRRANFYSQQIRALALVKALVESGAIQRNKSEVAVVGAGIAGLTASAALLTSGARVTLIDPNSKPLQKYRNAAHRELHPNIICWPFQELRGVTNLPFLNWSCGLTPDVIETILDEWDQYFASEVNTRIEKAQSLSERPDDDCVETLLDSGDIIKSTLAIITTGFLNEEPVGTFYGPEYWTPRYFPDSTEITVSGCGDGGLIDCATQIFGIKTTKAARELAYSINGGTKEAIAEVELEATKKFALGEKSKSEILLNKFYSTLSLNVRQRGVINKYQNNGSATVTLLYKEDYPFQATSAPINKVLVAALANSSNPRIKLTKGRLDEIGGGLQAETADGIQPIDPNRIIVRHGAKHSAWALICMDSQERLENADGGTMAEIVPDYGFRSFYERAFGPRISPNPHFQKNVHADRLQGLIERLLHYVCPGAFRINIDRSDDKNWVVRLPPTQLALVDTLFPMQFNEISVSLTKSIHAEAI